METIGQRFKLIRIQEKLSQEEFGEKIGLSKSAISAVENDKSFISVEIQQTLLVSYNINLNWLISGYGSMYNNGCEFDKIQGEIGQLVIQYLKEKKLLNKSL